jgi:aryl carrier-like protein
MIASCNLVVVAPQQQIVAIYFAVDVSHRDRPRAVAQEPLVDQDQMPSVDVGMYRDRIQFVSEQTGSYLPNHPIDFAQHSNAVAIDEWKQLVSDGRSWVH